MFTPWKRSSYEEIPIIAADEKESASFDNSSEHGRHGRPRYAPTTSCYRNLIWLVTVLCMLATVVTIIATSVTASTKSSVAVTSHRHCGNSSAEALANGCNWDQLVWAWLPPNCPHYGNDEYLAADEYTFFTDPSGRHAVTEETWAQAMDNKIELYSQRKEHLTHCVYMFRSVGMILRDGTPYTPRYGSYKHVEHCSNMLLNAIRELDKWDEVDTSVGKVGYEEYC